MNNCLDRRCSPRTVQHAAFLFDLRYLCLRLCQPGISSALKREAPVGRVSAVTVSGRSNSSHRGAAFQTFCSRCVLKSQQRVGCLGRWEWFCCWVTRRADMKAETHFHDTTCTLTSYTDLMPFCYWCVWDGMECVNLWPRLHCWVFENQDWSITPERTFFLLRFWILWVLFNVPFYITSFGWLCLWRSSWFTHHWESSLMSCHNAAFFAF